VKEGNALKVNAGLKVCGMVLLMDSLAELAFSVLV